MYSDRIAFTAPLTAELVREPVDAPGPGQILIEAERSLISAGTERFFFQHAPFHPFYPGYSLVGRVAVVGEGVTRFAVGDRVAASAPHGSLTPCDERMAFPIPEGVSDDHASFLSVGATALYGVRLAELSFGDPALVIGLGLIGLITSQLLRIAGAIPIIGVDIAPERIALGRSLGVDFALDARDETGLAAQLASLPGGGVAATIELSGAAGALERAIHATRRRGRVASVALKMEGAVDLYAEAFGKGVAVIAGYINARPWRLDTVELTSPADWPPRPFQGPEFEGNEVSTSAADTAMVLRLLQLGRLDVAPLITDVVDAKDAPALFGRLPASDFLGGLIKWR